MKDKEKQYISMKEMLTKRSFEPITNCNCKVESRIDCAVKDKEKQIEEMPICVNCIHAYVCEEYNLNRDMLRKRCAYYNDHFLDIEQHDTKLRKETAEKILNELVGHTFEDDGWTWTVSKEDIQWLADKYKVKIKE